MSCLWCIACNWHGQNQGHVTTCSEVEMIQKMDLWYDEAHQGKQSVWKTNDLLSKYEPFQQKCIILLTKTSYNKSLSPQAAVAILLSHLLVYYVSAFQSYWLLQPYPMPISVPKLHERIHVPDFYHEKRYIEMCHSEWDPSIYICFSRPIALRITIIVQYIKHND